MSEVQTFKVPSEALDVRRAVQELVADLPDTITVTSREEAQRTTDLLAAIARQRRSAEDARKALVKPLNDHVKFINGTFKENTAPLEKAERLLKRGLLDYQAAERRKAEEAQRAAEAEAERERTVAMLAGEDEPQVVAAPVQAPRTTVHGYGGTASVRRVWKYELTDMRALARAVADGKLPPEFLMCNPAAINAAIKDKEQPLREAPGLRIFQDDSLAVRA